MLNPAPLADTLPFKFGGTLPCKPLNLPILILPVISIFLYEIALFIPVSVGERSPAIDPVSGVYAIIVFGLTLTGRTRLRSNIFCLIITPVVTLVRAGTYDLIALNKELSKYLINLK